MNKMHSDSAITEVKEVSLTRPFVYMIVDSETQLPLFVGTVTEFSGE